MAVSVWVWGYEYCAWVCDFGVCVLFLIRLILFGVGLDFVFVWLREFGFGCLLSGDDVVGLFCVLLVGLVCSVA